MLQFCGRMQACTQPAAPRSCILQNLDIKCVHRGRAAQTCSLFQGRVRVFLFPHPVIRAAESDNDPCRPAEVRKIPENYAFKDGDTDEKKSSKESIMIKLRRYGVAGVLSYGLLNTVYYLGMFLFAWFYISPVPSGLGYRAAAERFIKLFALVWAGSQVTKLPRAGCALALAPAIDRGLTWFTNRFKFQSRGEAFGMIVASCFGLALVVFVIITFLWA